MVGNTINGKQVRSVTLKVYLKAAAEFITEAGLPDSRFITTTQHTMLDKYLPRIGKVLTKQKRWESMAIKMTQSHLIWCGAYRAKPPSGQYLGLSGNSRLDYVGVIRWFSNQ